MYALVRPPVHSLVHFDLFIFKANFFPKVGLIGENGHT